MTDGYLLMIQNAAITNCMELLALKSEQEIDHSYETEFVDCISNSVNLSKAVTSKKDFFIPPKEKVLDEDGEEVKPITSVTLFAEEE